jgi:hypothetical protein
MTRNRLRAILVWSGLAASLLVAGLLIIRWNEAQQLQPNETGVGPRASASAVSIDYPAEADPLGVAIGDWVGAWDPPPGGMPSVAVADRSDGIEFWVAETTTAGLSAAVDLAVRDGVVEVAQLAVENAAGDADDARLVDEVVPAFLAASGAPPGLAEELGLVDAEALFGSLPREQTVVDGGVTAYLAVNRFGFVLGLVGG